MSALTRTEAATRAALLDVDAYIVDLDLFGAAPTGSAAGESDPATGTRTFESRTVVRFRCARPGAASFAELRPEVLHAATLNGVPLDPATLVDGRLPLPDLRADNELLVRSRMAYTNIAQGLHRFVDPADGLAYVYGMTFLDAAPQVFACFDQPDLKAPVTLTVTADPTWTVIANGPVRARATGAGTGAAGTGAGFRRWEFETTKPLATYFTTLVAGPYHAVRAEHDGIPLGLYCRASLAGHLDREAPEILEVTAACLTAYQELFGSAYPFGKYDQAFVPEFHFGAMENPGCVTFRDEMVFRSAVTREERARRAYVIAHEMAHMWFGDLVTMRWWDDLWLNESFATYMGTRVTARFTRFTEAWVDFAIGNKARGYAADQRPSTHPVSADVPDTALALLNFDGISYAKGASVLRQLVAWLGDEAFLAGLRGYFAAHSWANASLSDLLGALTAASGRDLTAWSVAWLRTPGVSTLRPEIKLDALGRYARVAVAQTVPAEYPVPRPHRIGVGLYRRDGRRLALHERVEVDLNPERGAGPTLIPELAGREAADLLLLNDGDLTFAKVRLDGAVGPELADLLPGLVDPLARTLVYGAARDAVRDAIMPAGGFLRMAAAGLPVEDEEQIFDSVLGFAGEYVIRRYLPRWRRPAAEGALAAVCAAVLRGAEPGGSRQLVAARGWIRCAGPADVPVLRSWLRDPDGAGAGDPGGAGAGDPDPRPPVGLVIDAELRWALLYRLAVLGSLRADEVTAERERDRSAAGVEHAARVHAALADPAAKEQTWQALVHDRALSGRTLAAAAEGFWQPEQAALTQPYVARYFTDMPVMAEHRTAQVVAKVADAAFPCYAVTERSLAAADGLLGRGDLNPALRRAVTDATDELRRSLAARDLADRDLADRDLADRDLADRDLADRDLAERP